MNNLNERRTIYDGKLLFDWMCVMEVRSDPNKRFYFRDGMLVYIPFDGKLLFELEEVVYVKENASKRLVKKQANRASNKWFG